MTGEIQPSQGSAATSSVSRNVMRFNVDGWDPAYGTSLELEDYLCLLYTSPSPRDRG